jgi:hypothetical protein
MSFSRVERQLLMVGRASLSSRSHSLLSNLNTQSSLILHSHKPVRLSVGRADLSLQSPVVLCRSPLLSTSLTVPLKLSRGPGHGSRHRPVPTLFPIGPVIDPRYIIGPIAVPGIPTVFPTSSNIMCLMIPCCKNSTTGAI